MNLLRQPIKYYGAKWRLASWINARLPTTPVYVEVFGGSAAILCCRTRSPIEILNDLDSDVVNFWRQLRERSEELARLVASSPFAREEFLASFEPTNDPLERARRYVVRSWQTHRGGVGPRASSSWWSFGAGGVHGSPVHRWATVPDRLLAVADRIRDVQIEHDDWSAILQRYDHPDVLFYLDPPYLRQVLAVRAKYSQEMAGKKEHKALLEASTALRGAVAISGRRCALYDELLGGWQRHDTKCLDRSGKSSAESLWLSPSAAAGGIQGELW